MTRRALDIVFGDTLEFGNPEAFTLLPAVAICLCLVLLVQAVVLWQRPSPSRGSSYPRIGRMQLWFVAVCLLALMAVAAAEPRIRSAGTVFKRGPLDVVVAIDVSASMWVPDLGRPRLDIAVRELQTLQADGVLRPGDRAGLFVFGATAVRKAHLSGNFERLADALGKLSPPPSLTGDAFPWESDIAAALEGFYRSLDGQDRIEAGGKAADWTPVRRSNRIVLLVSDGDFDMSPGQRTRLALALAEFRRRGLQIFAVGVGSTAGQDLVSILRAYVPGRDYDETLAEELRDQRTVLRMANLDLLAQLTQGRTFAVSSSGRSSAPFVRGAIERHRAVSSQLVPREDGQEAWRLVVLAALMLLSLSILRY